MTTSIPRASYGAEPMDYTGDLPSPFPRAIGPNARNYLAEVVDSGLTVDMVGRFERAFAEAIGVKHCIATPGCTNAVMVLAEALRFEPGDEVIVSGITDYGTVMGLVKKNYIPVFADTEPGSPNIGVDTIAPCITDRTRAIVCVHKTGLVCDMDPIVELATRHGLILIEDACQAVDSRYRGRMAGTLGDAAVFSFDAEKTMGSDVGGCLVTDDDELAEYARFVGHSRGGEQVPGFGRVHTTADQALRMPLSTAAISLAQLEIIDDQVAHIDRMIRLLTDRLAEIPGIIPTPIPDHTTTYSCWMAGFSIEPGSFEVDAAEFARQCADAGLTGAGVAEYYLMPVACEFLSAAAHTQTYPYSRPPASRSFRYDAEQCPNAGAFLRNWIRWSTFCEKYQPADCELVAEIVARVAATDNRTAPTSDN